MSMKPTAIGMPPAKLAMPPVPSQLPAIRLDTGAIVLNDRQVPDAEKGLAAIDFAAMPSGDVIKIGLDAEQALQHTLDGFLARIDKNNAAAVFALFGRLEKGVEDANLPEILEKVQNGEKPGMFGTMLGKLRGKRPDEVASELMADVGAMVSGRTKTLADRMTKLELWRALRLVHRRRRRGARGARQGQGLCRRRRGKAEPG
jgi:hypothetical protein